MLMSKSRLEKFLYALYSLDSSDLPTPLSRIEELYKCLVTGEEAPTFEPLSRVEKYLMAILGVYDVNELPNPISRVEVLLHKLAIGDDNLDDVKSFLSEHEELLAEIIRNGGVGGNIDIEYVLYTLSTEFNTLYNTAEKPVKSAILKGQTLVNLVTDEKCFSITGGGAFKDESGFYLFDSNNRNSGANVHYQVKMDYSYKYNKTYTIVLFVKENTLVESFFDYGVCKFNIQPNETGVFKKKFNLNYKDTLYRASLSPTETGKIKIGFMLIEGDYTNVDIPYFEGMQSVKMPVLTMSNVIQRVEFEKIKMELSNGSFTSVDYEGSASGCMEYFDISKLTNAKFIFKTTQSFTKENYFTFFFYDKDKIYIKWLNGNFTKIADGLYSSTIPTLENAKYLRVTKYNGDPQMSNIVKNSISAFVDNSLFIDSTFSIKSNILSTSEDVVLRGIGDVRDTLDLMIGEVTERVGYNIVDGVNLKAIRYYPNDTDYAEFHVGFPELKANAKTLSTFSPSYLKAQRPNNGESFWANDAGYALGIIIQKTKLSELSIDGLNEYLKSNPIEFCYELETESIKTVDLSVVDQDGNDTELSTFDDITHVTLSSEGLIPEVELGVATKNEEVLSTLSLEMDDISTSQNTLEETANTQSENVDATMIATTEIYEELL